MTKIKCRNCGERFDPEYVGGWVPDLGDCCDNCYLDNTFECCACHERDSETSQRQMLVISGNVRFLSAGRAKHGIYRVIKCPYYGGPIIGECHLYDESLEYLMALPPGIDTDDYPCGHLCRQCQQVANMIAGVRVDLATKLLFHHYDRHHNHHRRRPRYDTPIRFRVGSTVVHILSRKRYLVAGHSPTGESGKSPGVYGYAIEHGRFGLHPRWLGPEYYCEPPTKKVKLR
jgi:hypothetical protein